MEEKNFEDIKYSQFNYVYYPVTVLHVLLTSADKQIHVDIIFELDFRAPHDYFTHLETIKSSR